MAVSERVARRDQILEVAAQLFSERGYHGTSMQDLAEGLGILRGSIYAHIDSKEDLLFEIVDNVADRFLERATAISQAHSPGRRMIAELVRSHATTVAGNLHSASVFLHEWRHLSPRRRRRILEKRRAYERIVREMITKSAASGHLRKGVDEKLAALLILSSVNWMYQWFDPQGPLSAEAVADRFTAMIMNGIEEGATR